MAFGWIPDGRDGERRIDRRRCEIADRDRDVFGAGLCSQALGIARESSIPRTAAGCSTGRCAMIQP
jgi:hypothetical protein